MNFFLKLPNILCTAIIKAVLACVLGLNIRKRIPGVKKA